MSCGPAPDRNVFAWTFEQSPVHPASVSTSASRPSTGAPAACAAAGRSGTKPRCRLWKHACPAPIVRLLHLFDWVVIPVYLMYSPSIANMPTLLGNVPALVTTAKVSLGPIP